MFIFGITYLCEDLMCECLIVSDPTWYTAKLLLLFCKLLRTPEKSILCPLKCTNATNHWQSAEYSIINAHQSEQERPYNCAVILVYSLSYSNTYLHKSELHAEVDSNNLIFTELITSCLIFLSHKLPL